MIENGTSARILNFLNYYTDPLLGGTIKTTTIARRMSKSLEDRKD